MLLIEQMVTLLDFSNLFKISAMEVTMEACLFILSRLLLP